MLTIKFQSSMYLYVPGNKKIIQKYLPRPKALKEVLASIGVTGREVGLIILNNKKVGLNDTMVKNGDVIELYPFMGGG